MSCGVAPVSSRFATAISSAESRLAVIPPPPSNSDRYLIDIVGFNSPQNKNDQSAAQNHAEISPGAISHYSCAFCAFLRRFTAPQTHSTRPLSESGAAVALHERRRGRVNTWSCPL